MTLILTTLKKMPYLLLTLVLTLVLWAFYTFFDLRQGGTHLTIFSLHVMSFQYFVERFGLIYVVGRIMLDLLIAFFSALTIALVVDNYRNGTGMFGSSACSTGATFLLGFATFGCPSCVLPIAGTFGVILTSETLPLFGFEFKILALLISVGTLLWLLYRLKLSSHEDAVVLPHKVGILGRVEHDRGKPSHYYTRTRVYSSDWVYPCYARAKHVSTMFVPNTSRLLDFRKETIVSSIQSMVQ